LAVHWRRAQLFDPVLRHELAHVRHGDVPLALLARSVGLIPAPLLALPLVVGLLIGDSSLTCGCPKLCTQPVTCPFVRR
jgi:Zn-dependent protease with chaperone function